MGVRPDVDFHDVIEYNSRSLSIAVQEREEAAEAGPEGDALVDDALNIKKNCGAGRQEGGGEVSGFVYGGNLGARSACRHAGPTNQGQECGSAPVFAETSTHHGEPTGQVHALLWDMLDDVDVDFKRVFRALAEVV